MNFSLKELIKVISVGKKVDKKKLENHLRDLDYFSLLPSEYIRKQMAGKECVSCKRLY